LTFVLYPQLGDHSVEKIALDYVDAESEEADLEVLDEVPPVFMTPRKLSEVQQEAVHEI